MKKHFASILAICMLFLVACETNHHSPPTAQALPPTEIDTKEDDFIYKLYTEKDIYEAYTETMIVTELTYVGDEDSIEIMHAATPFTFSLKEKARTAKATSMVPQLGMTRTLKKDEPFIQKVDISKGFVVGDNKRVGLPAGEYVLNGSANFHLKNGENYKISGEIGFIVK